MLDDEGAELVRVTGRGEHVDPEVAEHAAQALAQEQLVLAEDDAEVPGRLLPADVDAPRRVHQDRTVIHSRDDTCGHAGRPRNEQIAFQVSKVVLRPVFSVFLTINGSSCAPMSGMSSEGGAVWQVARTPALRRLLGAFSASRVGDVFYNTALVAVVLERTGSAAWVAATIVAQAGPQTVLTPFAGVLADRMDRRRLMVLTDLARFAAMVVATVAVAASAPVVVLVLVALLAATLGTPFASAFAALLPEVVDEDRLGAANAVISAASYAAIVVGPLLAAVALIGGLDALPFAVNGVTFLLSAALIGGVRSRRGAVAQAPVDGDEDDDEGAVGGPVAQASRESFGSAFVTGFRVLVRVPLLRVTTVLSVVLMALYGVQLVLLPLVSRDLLGTGAEGLGWLNASLGVGGVLAVGLGARLASGSQLGLWMVVSGVGFGLTLALVGTTTLPAVAYALLVSQGVAAFVQEVCGMTALQRAAAPDQIARVDGLLASLSFAALVAGNLLAPVLVATVGLRPAVVGSGVVVAVLSLGVLLDPGARPVAPPDADVAAMVRDLPRCRGSHRPPWSRWPAPPARSARSRRAPPSSRRARRRTRRGSSSPAPSRCAPPTARRSRRSPGLTWSVRSACCTAVPGRRRWSRRGSASSAGCRRRRCARGSSQVRGPRSTRP